MFGDVFDGGCFCYCIFLFMFGLIFFVIVV